MREEETYTAKTQLYQYKRTCVTSTKVQILTPGMQPQPQTREEEETYTPKTQSVWMEDVRRMAGGGWNQRARESESERDSERVRCWRLVRLGEPLLWYRFTGSFTGFTGMQVQTLTQKARVQPTLTRCMRMHMPVC